jgi:hypothetical protein
MGSAEIKKETPRHQAQEFIRRFTQIMSFGCAGFPPPKAATLGFDLRKSAQSADKTDFLGL